MRERKNRKIRLEICPHLVMQWLRTREYRDTRIEFAQKTAQAFTNRWVERNYPDQPDKKPPICHVSEDGAAFYHCQDMFDEELHHKLNNAFFNHIWLIGVNNSEQPLYTSDNPVVRQAHVDDIVNGGMGFLSRGIEFLYPLSPQHVLILRERTHFKHNEGDENKAILLNGKEVNRCNKLQIIQSTRQIFSPINEFNFAQKFCKQHPHLVAGERERFDVRIQEVPNEPLRDYIFIRERPETIPL